MKPNRPDTNQIAQLVVQVKEGNETALAELITLVEAHVFRFCVFLTGDRHFAQDLCQDTLVRALEAISQLKEPDKFMGWIFSVCRRLFIDHCRAAPPEISPGDEDEAADFLNLIASDQPNPDVLAQIRMALLELEPEDRTLILLVDVEEYSYKEAADVLGISENAVRSRVHRVRKKFVERFES